MQEWLMRANVGNRPSFSSKEQQKHILGCAITYHAQGHRGFHNDSLTSDFKGVSFDDPKKSFALSLWCDAVTEIIKLFLLLLRQTIQLVSDQRGQDLGYSLPV